MLNSCGRDLCRETKKMFIWIRRIHIPKHKRPWISTPLTIYVVRQILFKWFFWFCMSGSNLGRVNLSSITNQFNHTCVTYQRRNPFLKSTQAGLDGLLHSKWNRDLHVLHSLGLALSEIKFQSIFSRYYTSLGSTEWTTWGPVHRRFPFYRDLQLTEQESQWADSTWEP